MRRTLPVLLALVLSILFCTAVLAQAPAPAPAAPNASTPPTTADADALDALFAPLAGAQQVIVLCSPPTNDVCVNKQCQCARFTCSKCGIKTFTCDPATGNSTCVCKTC